MLLRNFWQGFDSRRRDLEGGAVIDGKDDDSFQRKTCEGEITCGKPVMRRLNFEILLGVFLKADLDPHQ